MNVGYAGSLFDRFRATAESRRPRQPALDPRSGVYRPTANDRIGGVSGVAGKLLAVPKWKVINFRQNKLVVSITLVRSVGHLWVDVLISNETEAGEFLVCCMLEGVAGDE